MTDPVLRELIQKAEAEIPALIEKGIKKLYQHEFIDFDASTLSKMKNEELAAWQSQFPSDSPQYIIALQEWNNRSISRQLKWVRFTAIVGPIATIIAALLGYFLRDMQIETRQQIQSRPAIEQTNKVPSESRNDHPIIETTEPQQTEKKIK